MSISPVTTDAVERRTRTAVEGSAAPPALSPPVCHSPIKAFRFGRRPIGEGSRHIAFISLDSCTSACSSGESVANSIWAKAALPMRLPPRLLGLYLLQDTSALRLRSFPGTQIPPGLGRRCYLPPHAHGASVAVLRESTGRSDRLGAFPAVQPPQGPRTNFKRREDSRCARRGCALCRRVFVR